MTGTSQLRSTVDIKATAEKHEHLAKGILAGHAISGCDTVSCLYGIGKVTIIKVMHGGLSIEKLGNPNCEMKDIVLEASRFISACYGTKVSDDMSMVRFEFWNSKLSKKILTSAPELKTLPPTTAAFELHVQRAHYQVMIWKAAEAVGPPTEFDPTQFGWECEDATNSLLPIPLPANVLPVPEVTKCILKLIKCGCSATRPCATGRCSCVAAKLACSIFCAYNADDNNCHNDLTRAAIDVASNVQIVMMP
jgi:hypothetical protein